MRVRHLVLATADPASLRPFYADALGLPVSDTPTGFIVAVGESAVEFRQANTGTDPFYHVAFSVPGGSIDDAAEWLAVRTDLLTDDDRERFRYEFIGADAIYAADPAGNVLELLARDGRDRPDRPEMAGPDVEDKPFGPASFLDVGEIGIVTEEVCGAARALDDVFDLPGEPNEGGDFAYLGDADGAFVLVAPGRRWYPTDREAAPSPLTAVVEGSATTVSIPEGPVSVVGVDTASSG